MTKFERFVERLKEDGFDDCELGFLAVSEGNYKEGLEELLLFKDKYNELVEMFIKTLNDYHSDCGMFL